MIRVLIGIDDTDNDTSPGTGRLARRISEQLSEIGARPLGITRHQFLLDPRVPSTRDNHGACIAIEWPRSINELNVISSWITDWSAAGSDPGLCIAELESVSPAVMDWGLRVMNQVVSMEEAASIAHVHNIRLQELGGSGQGIIGALAAVGLHAEGNNGHFGDLPGLRSLGDSVSRQDLDALGIDIEHFIPEDAPASVRNAAKDDATIYQTFGHVRPRLVGGRPVWLVQWSQEHEWIPVDRKKNHSLCQH